MTNSTRILATLALTALALVARAQPGPDNPFRGSGSITSQNQFQRQIHDGNVVRGTEFFTLTYEGSWELVRTDETDDKRKPECNRRCIGGKHAQHDECDDSCDRPCPARNHRFSFSGHTDYLTKAMREAESDADNLVRLAGADPYAANWTSFLTRSLSNAKRMSEQVRQYVVPCWNIKPCNFSTRYYGVRKYEFRFNATLFEDGFYMSGGVKTPYARRTIGQHAKTVAYVWLPEGDPFMTSYTPLCKCKREPAPRPFIRDGWAPPIFDGFNTECPKGQPCDGIRYRIIGVDLNRVHIIAENGTDQELVLVVNGGTLLQSSDSGVQSMMILVNTRLSIPAGASKEADARAACIEMEKREPTPGTSYSLMLEDNPALRDCAAITNAARFRGPQDQARVWLVTDHVNSDELRKHLLPAPSAGQYLNALYDVSRADGIEILEPSYRSCLDAKLLAGSTAHPDATRWLVQTLDHLDPNSLLRFVKEKGADMAAALSKADDIDLRHAVTLANALTTCSSHEGRMAGLEFLMVIPSDKRAVVADKGALDSLLIPLESENAEEREKALEVVDVYAHKPSRPEVERLAGRGDVRAKEVMARLGN